MAVFESELRRVTLHTNAVDVDLALPAGIPLAALLPSIVNIIDRRHHTDPSDAAVPTGLQFSRLGGPALSALTTLAQNGIQDGDVLVLTQCRTDPPAPRFADPAEAVCATLKASAQPWTRPATRLAAAIAANWLTGIGIMMLIRNTGYLSGNHSGTTIFLALASSIALLLAVVAHRRYNDAVAGLALSLVATGLSSAAGFAAVPGTPGAPHVLLATIAGATTAVVAMRVTGCGTVTLTAISGCGAVIGIAALVGVLSEASLPSVGAFCTVLSVGLVEISPRISIALAGLSPRMPLEAETEIETESPDPRAGELSDTENLVAAKAIRADDWLTSLLAAFSSSATIGALSTTIAAPRTGLSGTALAAVTGLVLLLRARSQTDLTKTLILLCSGIATVSAIFVVTVAAYPQHQTWLAAATALLAGSALGLGFVAPGMLSPAIHRIVDLLEYLALAASVPLAGWLGGLYRTARDLQLLRT